MACCFYHVGLYLTCFKLFCVWLCTVFARHTSFLFVASSFVLYGMLFLHPARFLVWCCYFCMSTLFPLARIVPLGCCCFCMSMHFLLAHTFLPAMEYVFMLLAARLPQGLGRERGRGDDCCLQQHHERPRACGAHNPTRGRRRHQRRRGVHGTGCAQSQRRHARRHLSGIRSPLHRREEEGGA